MAAMRATETVAKVVGCFNENRVSENNNVIRVYSDTPLTQEEWAKIYCPKESSSGSLTDRENGARESSFRANSVIPRSALRSAPE
jgi:hypothetical protein